MLSNLSRARPKIKINLTGLKFMYVQSGTGSKLDSTNSFPFYRSHTFRLFPRGSCTKRVCPVQPMGMGCGWHPNFRPKLRYVMR